MIKKIHVRFIYFEFNIFEFDIIKRLYLIKSRKKPCKVIHINDNRKKYKLFYFQYDTQYRFYKCFTGIHFFYKWNCINYFINKRIKRQNVPLFI